MLSSFVEEAFNVRFAELVQGVFLELAHAFLGKTHHRSDFLQVQVGIHLETVIELEDFLFLVGEVLVHDLVEYVGAVVAFGQIVGTASGVKDGIAKRQVAVIANGGVQRGRRVAHHQDLFDFVRFVLGKTFERFRVDGERAADDLVYILGVTVEAAQHQFLFGANADHAALFREGAGDVLANPPHSVADKLDFQGAVETTSGFDEAHVPFVDEFHDVETTALVKVSNIDDKAEVGIDQHVQGGLVAFCRLLEQYRFLFSCE